jgi:hypothetical protein
MDIYGNELADSLAKEATQQSPDSDETSFAVLGSKIKQASTKEWLSLLHKDDQLPNQNPASYRRTFPWKLQPKIQLPPGTKREQASALFQLKLGHGYMKSYLYKLGHSESDLYCCKKKETIEHLLLSCKELGAARKELQDELQGTRLSLILLLHTKTGIEKTLGFLKKTRIVTRKWHLARREELEELGEDFWDELAA